MKPFARSERVSGQIQKVLSDILQKQIKDPRLKMATITRVTTSSDLRLARIYFTTSDTKINRNQAIEGFNSACGYVKRTLARKLGLRYMPELRFFYDDAYDHNSHIDQLIKSIAAEHELDYPPTEK